MTDQPFDTDTLDLLDRTKEVDIETWSPAGKARRRTIWIVVADGVLYVRSVRGERGRWYQDLHVEPHGAIHAQRTRIPFRAVPATDEQSVAACSQAFRAKYGRGASVVAMVQPETLPTTLRLVPA